MTGSHPEERELEARLHAFGEHVAFQVVLRSELVVELRSLLNRCDDPLEAVALYRYATARVGEIEWLVTAMSDGAPNERIREQGRLSVPECCAALRQELLVVDSIMSAPRPNHRAGPGVDDELQGLLVAADTSRPTFNLRFLESWADECLLPNAVSALQESGLHWPKQPKLFATFFKRISGWGFESAGHVSVGIEPGELEAEDLEALHRSAVVQLGVDRIADTLLIDNLPSAPLDPAWALPAVLEWMAPQLVRPDSFIHAGAHFLRSPDGWMVFDHRFVASTLMMCINRALTHTKLVTSRQPGLVESVLYSDLRGDHLERYTEQVLRRSLDRPAGQARSVLNLEASRPTVTTGPPTKITEIDVVARAGDLSIRAQCKAGNLEVDLTRAKFQNLFRPWKNNLSNALNQVITHRQAAAGTYEVNGESLPVTWHERATGEEPHDVDSLLNGPVVADLIVTLGEAGLSSADPTSLKRLLGSHVPSDPPLMTSISELENMCILPRPGLAQYLAWRRWIQMHEPHWVVDDRAFLGYWMGEHLILPGAPFTVTPETGVARTFLMGLMHQPALAAADAVLRGEQVPPSFRIPLPPSSYGHRVRVLVAALSLLNGSDRESIQAAAVLMAQVTNAVVMPPPWNGSRFRAVILWDRTHIPLLVFGALDHGSDLVERFMAASGLIGTRVADIRIDLKRKQATGGWRTDDPRAVIDAVIATPPPESWSDLYDRRTRGEHITLAVQPEGRRPNIPSAHRGKGGSFVTTVQPGQPVTALCGTQVTRPVDSAVLPPCPECEEKGGLKFPRGSNRAQRRRKR